MNSAAAARSICRQESLAGRAAESTVCCRISPAAKRTGSELLGAAHALLGAKSVLAWNEATAGHRPQGPPLS